MASSRPKRRFSGLAPLRSLLSRKLFGALLPILARPISFAVGGVLLVAAWVSANSSLSGGPRSQDTKPIIVNTSSGERFLTSRFTRRSVGIDSQGGFVATWQDETPQGKMKGVYARAFGSDGSPRGPEIPVYADPAGSPNGAVVAVSPSGRAMVVWAQTDTQARLGREIWAQRLGTNGHRDGAAFRVSGQARGRQGNPSVAAGDDETFAVVWTGVVKAGFGAEAVFARRFSSLGVPLTAEIRVTEESDTDPGEASVAVLPDGRITVVYASPQQGPRGVYLRQFDGQSLGPTSQTSVVKTGVFGTPSVAANDDGKLLAVTWQVPSDQDDSHALLRILDGKGQPRTPAIQVDTSRNELSVSSPPTVSFSGHERVLVGWGSSDGGQTRRVVGRYFSLEGRPEEGVAFWIDDGLAGLHSGVSISANSSGDAAAVWNFSPRSAGQNSILARRWTWPRRSSSVH